jgi:TonB family protein
MKLLVSREGVVQEVVVTESVNKVMDQQAVAAARQWAYSPAKLDGVPVPVRLKVHVGWHLS